MIPMTMDEVRRAVQGRWCSEGVDVMVEGVSIDSRTAKPGDLFVAIRGENFDGHNFLDAAARAGCIAAMVDIDGCQIGLADESDKKFGAGMISVDNTLKALGALAVEHRKRASVTTVIGITGSNGKTTTKRMLDHILRRHFTGSASPKSFNNDIGVPLTLLGVKRNDDYVICEIGTNAPGEIRHLGRMTHPDIGVITSVGPTHLEKLGSLEKVAIEKASLLSMLTDDALAIVWGDSDELNYASMAYDGRMVKFGRSDQCQLRLSDYRPVGRGCRFEINNRLNVELSVTGSHNALNAMAAIAVAQRMGIDPVEAAADLADFAGVEMRQEWIQAGTISIINDAYNANPSSLAAAGEVLSDTEATRRVLIAGDMRELGQDAEQFHLQAGQQLARSKVNLLIGVGPLGRYIARGGSEGGLETMSFDSVEDISSEILKLLQPGDAVLVKGSRSMGMERLVETIRNGFENPRKE
ncbi:MAG: UDP-N-acetylmuramoyl-tripeptide--D-alanyl-D-alanine ligase [Phycisphaerales bacterium]|nr:UDP-N-acetylmuramoyl-tripeptide--D-alanyl-D-alanine ligase [Phycisphaerales bacterium]